MLIVLFCVCAIFYFSYRIILRLVLPSPAVARFDAFVSAVGTLAFKVAILALAAGIVWLIVAAPPP